MEASQKTSRHNIMANDSVAISVVIPKQMKDSIAKIANKTGNTISHGIRCCIAKEIRRECS